MVKNNYLYEIIGVSPNAVAAEIKKGYRLRALALHPDKNQNDETSKERFQELQKAYEILRNEESRKLYDETGIIEGEENKNFEDIIDYFKQFTKKISEKDIQEYKEQYRGSDDEWEDLSNFYVRFNGNCKLLLEYIPFSEPDDVDYYVCMIEDAIKEGRLPQKKEFKGSIKELHNQAKKWKARMKRDKSKHSNDMKDLVQAIQSSSKKRMGNFANIISRFNDADFEEVDESRFQEIQENLVKNKKKKR
ncbi:DnaJ domain-containing protein [Cryptosporidium ubiquitum]|uniref:DnaJ domain-containing protein n=1 Tax=Cryptosporidium ubiquitum TaxID=857276 RepID=A0A1J4MG71_9CRYT|nr:DnaJ domain-containing protein [Cryptosporidium ubiquitum]OII73015.1 DnaJ domain-containing protein [Cryptosporidium ubiquitum]